MRRYLIVIACAAELVLSAFASAENAPADLILLHGRIHTEDAKRSIAQSLAVRGNTIIAVGTDQEVSAHSGPGTRSIDLGGKVVLPGFIDAQTQPAKSAEDLKKCDLGDRMRTPKELKTQVAACLKTN